MPLSDHPTIKLFLIQYVPVMIGALSTVVGVVISGIVSAFIYFHGKRQDGVANKLQAYEKLLHLVYECLYENMAFRNDLQIGKNPHDLKSSYDKLRIMAVLQTPEIKDAVMAYWGAIHEFRKKILMNKNDDVRFAENFRPITLALENLEESVEHSIQSLISS